MQDQREPTPSDPARRVERTFAQRMRELRHDRGLSQAKLADKLRKAGLNIDPSAITRIEKHADGGEGARAIYLGEAAIISRALGVRLPEMLRETVTPMEQFEQAAIALLTNASQLENATERLALAHNEATTAQQRYQQSLKLLDEDDQGDPRVQFLRGQVERYKRHQELRARHAALTDYVIYLEEQERQLEVEIAERDPETEVHTVRDRRDRLAYTRDRRHRYSSELRIVTEELAEVENVLTTESGNGAD